MSMLATFIIILALLFVVTLTLNVLNKSMSSTKIKTWKCETCDIELTRLQIKFGLCPKCGRKIKGFRGLRGYGSIT